MGDSLDSAAKFALVWPNLTFAPGTPTLSIELKVLPETNIKPKCGILCTDSSVNGVKCTVSRFQMHRVLKNSPSRYDPLDLFSADEDR